MHCKIRPQHHDDDVHESDMQYYFSYRNFNAQIYKKFEIAQKE